MKSRIVNYMVGIATIIAVFLFSFVLLNSAHVVGAQIESSVPVNELEQMLYPTVLVRVGGGSGSGTVIHSAMNADGEYESFILTNHHVISSYVKITKIWSSDAQEHVETETRRPVNIDLWEYNNYSTAIGTMGRIANIVAYDKSRDLALLQIEDSERPMPYIAVLYPEGADGPWIFQPVFAVGAGLGKPPFPTTGVLAGYGRDQDGNSLFLATAPIIFGNSGGSLHVFHDGKYFLIGVPSMVSGYGWGGIVTHMAWSRPISEIRKFLRNAGYGETILGDKPDAQP